MRVIQNSKHFVANKLLQIQIYIQAAKIFDICWNLIIFFSFLLDYRVGLCFKVIQEDVLKQEFMLNMP